MSVSWPTTMYAGRPSAASPRPRRETTSEERPNGRVDIMTARAWTEAAQSARLPSLGGEGLEQKQPSGEKGKVVGDEQRDPAGELRQRCAPQELAGGDDAR